MKYKKDLLDMIKDNFIIVLIVFWLISYFLFKSDTDTYDNVDNSSNLINSIKDQNPDSDIEFVKTDKGIEVIDKYNNNLILSLYNDEGINRFIEDVNNDMEYSIDNYSSVNNQYIWLIIDNTFSYKNWDLNVNLPEYNLKNAVSFLNNNFTGMYLKVWFLFASWSWDEKNINTDVYKFVLKPNVLLFSDKIRYDDLKYHNLYLDHSIIKKGNKNSSDNILYITWCNIIWLNEFYCNDKLSLISEINNLYEKYFGNNYWSYLIDFLAIPTFGFSDLNDVYIFSDWEFQIQERTTRDHLWEINNNTRELVNNSDFIKFKWIYETPAFSIDNYNNNREWFETYWKRVFDKLNKVNYLNKKWQNIIFIGLNPEPVFNGFATKVYKDYIFDGCNLQFKY